MIRTNVQRLGEQITGPFNVGVTAFPRAGLGSAGAAFGAGYLRSDRCGCGGSRSRLAAAASGRLYGVDVPAMSFQLHEWDIHIVCRGADDADGASGIRVNAVAPQPGARGDIAGAWRLSRTRRR